MSRFQPGVVVDIVIRGALVDWPDEHALTISVPGCDAQIDIPLVDDEGGPLPSVKITRADIISDPPPTAADAPAGPDLAGAAGTGHNLYSAVRAAIDEFDLPPVDAMGAGTDGRYLRLRDERDRRTWATALGFTGYDGTWGDGTIRLLVTGDDVTDLGAAPATSGQGEL